LTELAPFFRLMEGFSNNTSAPVDLAHDMFLVGAILAQKPRDVLEFGIGTGLLTASIVYALAYNRRGRLTSVDNWFDWKGKEPAHAAHFRRAGVKIVAMKEEEFVRGAPTDGWDFLVSDGDHRHSHEWLDQHLRIVRNGGFMFFHDTNQPKKFPGLTTIERQLKDRGMFCLHFRKESRPDEYCHRGLLFAVNRKPRVERAHG
jgi:predicted O-methyltransferase YrrM